MAYISDFTFHNLSRTGNDRCFLDQNAIQNAGACNYLLQNYFAQDCTMSKAKLLATSQPCINYSGTMGSDICGSNIDASSQLLIGTINTHPRCRIDLFQRPFATVPFLGRGSVDPVLESHIMQGEEANSNRRATIGDLTEKSYLPYHTTPLIPEMKERVQNPHYMIESMAVNGWVRGGIDTRDLARDMKEY